MPDRFVLDSPQHASISGELCPGHGSDHLISGRTTRRAVLVGGLGAAAWLAMLALGQSHAQAAPAQPLPVGRDAVSATLGSIVKATTSLPPSPTHAAPAHVQHRTVTITVTSVVAKVKAQTHPVVHLAAATVSRVGRTTTPLTTTVTRVTRPVSKTVASVSTTAKHVTAPITTPITTTVPTPGTPRVLPVVVLAPAGPITARAAGCVTPTGTVNVLAGDRADPAGTGRASGSIAITASLRRHEASATSRARPAAVAGSGGLPSNPAPVPASPDGALTGSAASGSAHSHDSGSALVGRSARLATPASTSTVRPGSDRLPGDPIRSTDVSPD